MRLKILLLGGTNTPGFIIERACGDFQLEILRPPKSEAVFIDPPPHLIILTLSDNQPFTDLELLDRLKIGARGIPVIAIAVRSSEALAIAAFRAGCRDYLQYPYTQDELAAAIQRCVARSGPAAELPSAGFERLIGSSPIIQALKRYIERIAPRSSTVLITGETGTGKEVAAEILHRAGPNAVKPFVAVNCAAIPETLIESELFGHERGSFTGAAQATEGKLQQAAEGTIFLDEIGEMSPFAQAKILRAIESRQATRLGGRVSFTVRCRFIAATNCEIEQNIEDGNFRRDLYYRLNVARIRMPALRERLGDIPDLCRHFIAEMNRAFDFHVEDCDETVTATLLQYRWPGNIRELRNVIESAFLTGPGRRLTMADLPEWFVEASTQSATREPGERDRLLAALTAAKGNKRRAAESLHWSRTTVYRKLAKYQLQ